MSDLKEITERLIQETFDPQIIERRETVQSLWSGYGELVRYHLEWLDQPSMQIVAKCVDPPTEIRHPRGWNTSTSHQRKLHSYGVEACWYQSWAGQLSTYARVAECRRIWQEDGRFILLLEDLDEAGYPSRASRLTLAEAKSCVSWLAYFHGTFLEQGAEKGWPIGLWSQGCYWHLATRKDELQQMDPHPLQNHAEEIDQILRQSQFKTLVHGDAKVANFCFSSDRQQVAAVDFQYVGAGCGMSDLTYFMGSCFSDEECRRWHKTLLDYYFSELQAALLNNGKQIDFTAVEQDWRWRYPFAWADFQRFILGWMPGHYKDTGFSRSMSQQALEQLSELHR